MNLPAARRPSSCLRLQLVVASYAFNYALSLSPCSHVAFEMSAPGAVWIQVERRCEAMYMVKRTRRLHLAG